MAYVAITSEGGLFPADLLDRIATGDEAGQRAEDFGLASGQRLSDEIQGAFSDARSFWDAFQRRLAHSRGSSTSLTRDAWVLPLLERLGFELVFQRAAAHVGGDTFAFSHTAGAEADAPPVHVVAIEQRLDVRGDGSRRSPHALVQEYLNRSDALWGVVTNGSTLRLLRDSARVSHPTYVEFDLQAMVEGNLYSEFVALYRLLHHTRFPRSGANAHDCWLERYFQQGIDEGGRVRAHLAEGVEEALKELGTAFLIHRESDALREALVNGRLSAQDYYRQLLRLVYRFLFLLVAEERRLIFPPTADAMRQGVYSRYYGVGHLRDRCERHFADDHHSDLWVGLLRSFELFRDDDMAQQLGLAALGGELFGKYACRDLEGAGCENSRLLRAMFHLSTFKDERTRRRVNYAALDVEELGSVYEGLLEFQPHVEVGENPPFDLIAGSERRQTGSHYTPADLVRELVDHALVPVMEERLAGKRSAEEREAALLSLRVCDLAAGSGHFLLAAARRIAREVARVRSGEQEPAPEIYRAALRDAIRHCVYAVDKNPLAIDLCKVALWIEGHNAGLPLSFLDSHIKHGDALVGLVELGVLAAGIPDEAFQRPDAKERVVGRSLRERNHKERIGQSSFGDVASSRNLDDLAHLVQELERLPDDTSKQVVEKRERYETVRGEGSDWWLGTTACHLWTLPFFATLKPDGLTPTSGDLWDFLKRPKAVDGRMIGSAWGSASDAHHPYFHWPLEFPEVFERGGFDVVLGNPPFLGGNKMAESLGAVYRSFLATTFSPTGGTADLCAYFFRRAFAILRAQGSMGMVATKTISQGDTREGGLALMIQQGGSIAFAHRFIKWPGTANVEVNLVVVRKAVPAEQCVLDGQETAFISSRLDQEEESQPQLIVANKGRTFQGSIVLGKGFLLDPNEARQLIEKNEKNRDCLFPFLTGEDLLSRPDQSPSRWAINFFDWSLEKATTYSDLIGIVRTKVKPERDKVTRPRRRDFWWQYGEMAVGLYNAIAPLRRILVRAQTSDTHALCFVPLGYVYSMMVIVFTFEDDYHFAILQSNLHEAWTRRNASTMRTDTRYTPSDCFDTYPFPQQPMEGDTLKAGQIGAAYHAYRQQLMSSRSLGLTKTYNLFNSSACSDSDVVSLREIHAEMDYAVLRCYGWHDMILDHGFHENERGQTRYTISPQARCEVLRRLLALNLEIAAVEGAAHTQPPVTTKLRPHAGRHS